MTMRLGENRARATPCRPSIKTLEPILLYYNAGEGSASVVGMPYAL
jgi:hypothetical protein